MITGLLEQRPLPEILQQLHTDRFTGELVINSKAGMIQIYTREGYPVYVNISESTELLGRILVDMGSMDETALRRSLAVPQQPGQRYGDVLLNLGLCDQGTLKQALRAQVRRKLHRLFALTEGGYVAVPGEHGRGMQEGESLRVHPRRSIYHGVRSWPVERLRALLQPLTEQAIKLRDGDLGAHVSRYGLSREDGHVVDLLSRGYFTVQELCEIAGFEAQLTLAVVYALWVTGELLVADKDQVERARDHITELPQLPPLPQAKLTAERPLPPAPAAAAVAPAVAPSVAPAAAPELVLKLESDEAPAKPPPVAAAAARPTSQPSIPNTQTGSSQKNLPAMGAAAAPARQPAGTPHTGTPLPTGPVRVPQPAARQRPVSFEEVALLRAELEKKSKVIEDESLFTVLGVGETADQATIKQAYLNLAKKFHPDRVVSFGLQANKEQAEKIFRRVNEAHSVLTDPARREEYIAELKLKSVSSDKADKEKELAVRAINAELAFSRGMVFYRKRDYASASREFEESVRLNPDEGEHLGYYAWTRFCSGQGQLSDSLKDMVKAIKMAPECGRLYYFIGVLYKQNDNEEKALSALRKAVDLDPRIEEAQSEIRVMQARRGRRGPKSADSKPAPAKSSESRPGDRPGDKKDGEKKKLSFLDKLRQIEIGGSKK